MLWCDELSVYCAKLSVDWHRRPNMRCIILDSPISPAVKHANDTFLDLYMIHWCRQKQLHMFALRGTCQHSRRISYFHRKSEHNQILPSSYKWNLITINKTVNSLFYCIECELYIKLYVREQKIWSFLPFQNRSPLFQKLKIYNQIYHKTTIQGYIWRW